MSLSIGKKAVRKMALLLLDDDNGINLEAYGLLSAMLVESGNDDILDAVDVTESRAYVGEDFAEEELNKLDSADAEEDPIQECEVDSDGCLKDNDGDAETDMEDRND